MPGLRLLSRSTDDSLEPLHPLADFGFRDAFVGPVDYLAVQKPAGQFEEAVVRLGTVVVDGKTPSKKTTHAGSRPNKPASYFFCPISRASRTRARLTAICAASSDGFPVIRAISR